jgi:hypothetical protein
MKSNTASRASARGRQEWRSMSSVSSVTKKLSALRDRSRGAVSGSARLTYLEGEQAPRRVG